MYRLKISFFLLFSLTLSSCCPLTSLNPLSDPDKAEYDKRIEGLWKLQDDKEFLHIGKGPANKTLMIYVEHKGSGKINLMKFNVFPTIVGNQNYLNINIEEYPEGFIQEGIVGYIFVKYELLDSKTLALSMLEDKPVIEAIKTGKLKGEITNEKAKVKKEYRKHVDKEQSVECVKITDSSDNIINFLQSGDSKKLFDDFQKFTRIE